jgi:hypothetical protein
MSRQPTPPVAAKDLQGFKYFALVTPLLARLHDDGTAGDKAGNRRLFFDQYAALLLLYFFNPILTSLNGLQQASVLVVLAEILARRKREIGAEIRPPDQRHLPLDGSPSSDTFRLSKHLPATRAESPPGIRASRGLPRARMAPLPAPGPSWPNPPPTSTNKHLPPWRMAPQGR